MANKRNDPAQAAATAARRQQRNNSGGGGGGGGSSTTGAPTPITTTPVGPIVPEITGGTKKNPTPGDTGITHVASALLPLMSKTDAQTQASLYGLQVPQQQTPDFVPNTTTPGQTRNVYMSADRATQALTALQNMAQSQGNPDWGPGYAFLTNALGLLKQYGGQNQENGMSRENYNAFNQAFNDLMNQTKLDKSVDDYAKVLPYINLAQAFLTPNMGGKTTEQLMNQTKVAGQTFPGQAAPQLFT